MTILILNACQAEPVEAIKNKKAFLNSERLFVNYLFFTISQTHLSAATNCSCCRNRCCGCKIHYRFVNLLRKYENISHLQILKAFF